MTAEIGWLAGIIDGEGTISLGKSKGCPWPRMTIPSTTPEIVKKSSEILSSMGIHYTSYIQAGINLPCTIISVGGKACVDSLILLLPYIVRQTNRATDIIEFFDGRYEDETCRGNKRQRIIWSQEGRDEWERLRSNNKPR